MPAVAPQAPLPPDREEALEQVCPSCRLSINAFPDLPPPSGTMPKCPQHGLAFVDPHELAGNEGDSLLGATIAGRFTIIGRLGRGSMGAVYRARQVAVHRDVALKIVRRDRAYDPETKARFEREARAISALTSPHTVTAFDFGEAEDGSWFLAMEMLEGETVGERLRRERRLDWVDAARFARDALKSLAEAHTKGIIHRDLKPDNLFLVRLPSDAGRREEMCKVLDFGIAKWQGGSDAPIDQLETLAGTVFGTPRYMSPEQAQGSALDARSDIYSLGVLLYQMLTGRAPFIDDDAVVVMARHIKDVPPTFGEIAAEAGIPAPLEAAVFHALEKSPERRPQSAEQMGGELERAVELSLSLSGISTSPPSSKRHGSLQVEAAAAPELIPSLRSPRSRVRVWVLGLLALAALGLFALFRERAGSSTTAEVKSSVPPVASVSSASTPQAIRVEPTANVTAGTAESLENSNATPALTTTVQKPARTRLLRARPQNSSAAGLPRKGNERYGRFE